MRLESPRELGKSVRAIIGDGPTVAQRTLQRRLIIAAAVKPRRRNKAPLIVAAAAACILLTVSLAYVLRSSRPRSKKSPNGKIPVCFLDNEVFPEGKWLEAPHERALPLTFKKLRSTIWIEPRSRARLARVTRKRVEFSLESGRLRSSITPGTGLKWSFKSGPYRVTVLGTRFAISWEPEAHHFSVSVSRGRVRVDSRGQQNWKVFVSSGEKLRIAREGTRLVQTLTHAQPPSTHRAADLPPKAKVEDRQASQVDARKKEEPSLAKAPKAHKPAREKSVPREKILSKQKETPKKTTPKSSLIPWQILAEKGKYRQAFKEIGGKAKLVQLLQDLEPKELMLLADTCRFSGNADWAIRSLHAIRKKFSASPEAKLSAFLLGRLKFDHGKFKAAAHWFNQFISEGQDLEMVADARGRLVVSNYLLGDIYKARQAASAYLNIYPQGGYRQFCQALLESDGKHLERFIPGIQKMSP